MGHRFCPTDEKRVSPSQAQGEYLLSYAIGQKNTEVKPIRGVRPLLSGLPSRRCFSLARQYSGSLLQQITHRLIIFVEAEDGFTVAA